MTQKLREFGSNQIDRVIEDAKTPVLNRMCEETHREIGGGIELRNITSLIEARKKKDDEAIDNGQLSFEACRSNSDILPFHVDISPNNPHSLDSATRECGRKDDRIVCDGLREEFRKNDLLPDGSTFYVIDFGLPHLPALQSVLLDYDIDSSVCISPSNEEVKGNNGHYQRYVSEYAHHRNALFQKRKELVAPKGLAILINSHASTQERRSIVQSFPSIASLKEMGIKKLVLGRETFYHDGAPNIFSHNKSSQAGNEVNNYAKPVMLV